MTLPDWITDCDMEEPLKVDGIELPFTVYSRDRWGDDDDKPLTVDRWDHLAVCNGCGWDTEFIYSHDGYRRSVIFHADRCPELEGTP